MRPVAFVPLFCGLRFRTCASASPIAPSIIVETLSEKSAAVAWPPLTGHEGHYRVAYGITGEPLLSLRSSWLPNLKLYNLQPGQNYSIHVSPNGTSTSFQTPGSATPIKGSAVVEELPVTEISRLEIRVGRIVECYKHPEADTLYVEQVDCGEERPRTIVSGLVKYVSIDDMVGRSVIVLCNLKPRAMRGVTSHGMLLCASNENHTFVDPLTAPEGAKIGELVTFQGHRQEPAEPGNRASKAFDRVAADLCTDSNGVAHYQDRAFETSAGPCFSPAGVQGAVS